MGAGMDKILPGLYVGNLKDSMDREQIDKHGITHILSIHDTAADGDYKDIQYLSIRAADCAGQDLQQYFPKCIDFIHRARLDGGSVLVHCLAGISRSTTITIAYVMTVTDLSWVDAINAVRGARKVTNPNFGFQRQLQNYEFMSLKTEKEKLVNTFGTLNEADTNHCKTLLKDYHDNQSALGHHQHHNHNNDRTTAATTLSSTNEKIYPLQFNAYNLDSKTALTTDNNINNNKYKQNFLSIKNKFENKNRLKIKTNVDEETNDIKDIMNGLDHLEIENPSIKSNTIVTSNATSTEPGKTNDDLDKFFK